MPPTRREFAIGFGTAVAAVGAAGTTFALQQDDQSELTFGEINADAEYLVIHNEEDTDIDIDGYVMDWEHANEDYSQEDEFADEYGTTVIDAEDSITVATGARDVEDADVDFEHHENDEQMRNDGSDVYAILDESGEVIARSDEDRHQAADETPTETATETPTETETETETPEPTETETETETEESTPTPTECQKDETE